MNLLDTIPCEGCGRETVTPTSCDHFELCPDCRADHGCQKCRRIAQDERGGW